MPRRATVLGDRHGLVRRIPECGGSDDRGFGRRLRLRGRAVSAHLRPMFVHCCHCRDCQRQTGSAFVLNALIETGRITLLSGALEPVAVPTGSGRPHDIHRCRACRTALWSDYGRRPALRFVRVGTLDEPARLPPDVHIYTRSKLPWIELRRTSPPSRPTTTRRRCGPRPVSSAVGQSSDDRARPIDGDVQDPSTRVDPCVW